MSGMFFPGFLFISTHILLDLLSLGSAKAYIGWGGKLNGHSMASCVSIKWSFSFPPHAKLYQ